MEVVTMTIALLRHRLPACIMYYSGIGQNRGSKINDSHVSCWKVFWQAAGWLSPTTSEIWKCWKNYYSLCIHRESWINFIFLDHPHRHSQNKQPPTIWDSIKSMEMTIMIMMIRISDCGDKNITQLKKKKKGIKTIL